MTINRKGWYKEVSNFPTYEITYSSSKNPMKGVKIHIYKIDRENEWRVNTTGQILYLKDEPKSFNSLQKAEAYVRKIMRYVDYGRKQLNIVRDE